MQNTTSELISQLNDQDEVNRRAAAEDLGYLGNSEAIPSLVIALGDHDRSVAEAAAQSLAMIGGENVVNKISSLLTSEKPSVRNDVAEILVEIGESAVPSLVSALHVPDKDTRQFAVDSLSQINSNNARESLISALNDPEINVAVSAVIALGNLKSANAVPEIVKYMDRDPWMKGASLLALGEIATDEAIQVLKENMNDPDPIVQCSLVRALGKAKTLDGIPFLIEKFSKSSGMLEETIVSLENILESQPWEERRNYLHGISLEPLYNVASSSNLETRIRAIELLAELQQTEAVSFLGTLFGDEESEIRKASFKAVVALKPKDIYPLFEILDSSQTRMEAKAAALHVLGCLKDPESIPKIISFLDSQEITLQRVALNALFLPLDDNIIQKIKDKLSSSISEIRAHALIAIQRLQLVELIENIIPLLHDEDLEVRSAADDAFVALAPDSMDSFVTPFLKSFGPEERRLAFKYFSKHMRDELIPQLIEGLKDPEPDVRMVAVKALVNTIPKEAVKLIKPIFEDDHEKVVIAGIRAYGTIGCEECKNFLLNFLKNNSKKLYIYEVIEALGKTGDKSIISEIVDFLESEDVYLRLVTIEALKCIGGDDVLEILRSQYQIEEEEEVMSALENAMCFLES